jgi:hypothetical protein
MSKQPQYCKSAGALTGGIDHCQSAGCGLVLLVDMPIIAKPHVPEVTAGGGTVTLRHQSCRYLDESTTL